MDDATRTALETIRERSLPIDPEIIARAEAGEVRLGILEFKGQGLEAIRRAIADKRARLKTLDPQGDGDDARALCDAIGRLEGDLAYGEFYAAHPVIYVQAA